VEAALGRLPCEGPVLPLVRTLRGFDLRWVPVAFAGEADVDRNRNGEYVLVRNTGAAASTRPVGSSMLAIVASVLPGQVHAEEGRHGADPYRTRATRAGHLYLGSGRPIWNNDGDTDSLIDPHNLTVSSYRY
jgi:hypothetical protein